MDYKSLFPHPWGVSDLLHNSQQILAIRVKTLRMGLGLSQEAMALEAGIDRTYASQIERGVSNPSLRVICAVAKILGVEPVDLLSEKEKN